jgi:hypothetical protein
MSTHKRSWRDEILHKQAVRYRKEASADTLSLPLVPGKCKWLGCGVRIIQ